MWNPLNKLFKRKSFALTDLEKTYLDSQVRDMTKEAEKRLFLCAEWKRIRQIEDDAEFIRKADFIAIEAEDYKFFDYERELAKRLLIKLNKQSIKS